MSFFKKILGKENHTKPRIRVCVECGMPVAEHKEWCSKLPRPAGNAGREAGERPAEAQAPGPRAEQARPGLTPGPGPRASGPRRGLSVHADLPVHPDFSIHLDFSVSPDFPVHSGLLSPAPPDFSIHPLSVHVHLDFCRRCGVILAKGPMNVLLILDARLVRAHADPGDADAERCAGVARGQRRSSPSRRASPTWCWSSDSVPQTVDAARHRATSRTSSACPS